MQNILKQKIIFYFCKNICSMNYQKIQVFVLQQKSYLSKARCEGFAEAASVCLANSEHQAPVLLTVEGDLQAQFELEWQEITEEINNSNQNTQRTVEEGAYCVAMLVVEELTEFKAFKQSQTHSGVDYFLRKTITEDKKDFIEIRMEVSGILKGTPAQIEQRMKEKVQQSKQSDHLDMPALIVVVEFSRPLVKIIKR
ncbi:MAG: hypothetical protein EAZ97_04465 [Bacteroidetes bacterium]|nr:MAG: hypothetical protein EAZ97_04465 [Bacteroidota bacterium]